MSLLRRMFLLLACAQQVPVILLCCVYVINQVTSIMAWCVAGVSELPLPGAVVGPLFAKLIAVQFSLAKSGDRFFYENDCASSFASPCGRCNFNAAQLAQIKLTTLSRLLCDNTDIDTIQANAFQSRYVPLRSFVFMLCYVCNKLSKL